MKRLLAAGAIGLMLAGGSLVGAQAAPGPNGSNDHGLCTAYFNGQKTGHTKHGSPGPFAALEDAAEAEDQTVYEWCQAMTTIGGNGEHGRYPECFDDVADNGSDMCPDN